MVAPVIPVCATVIRNENLTWIMERRTAVKYLFAVAAGSALLPSCLHRPATASISLKHLVIDGDLERLTADIADTIIPPGAAPGARDTYAHLFVLRMVDDCYDRGQQEKFLNGLKEVDGLAEKRFGHSFNRCAGEQRSELLAALENKKASPDALAFYSIMKTLTIQGYLSSKPVLGDIFRYELVPGRYNGFFPVKTNFHQA